MTGDWKSARAAEYVALNLLRQSGYAAEKLTGRTRKFDIIAWKDNRPVCLVVRSSKRYTISSFPEQLATLSDILQSGGFPAEIQFWIYRRPGWKMYKIQPRGALPVTWSEA